MRELLIKCLFFILLLSGSILAIFLIEEGYSDPYYLKLTSPKQSSLIIGTSRAAQGLIPAVLNKELGDLTKHHIFNYAFTLANSPYGEVYFSSIQRKVADGNDGLFIVTVDPWSVAKGDSTDEELALPEHRNFLAKIRNVSVNPNLEYMLKFYPKIYANIIGARLRPPRSVLHNDGWLEIDLPMNSTAQISRKNKTLTRYQKKNGNFHISKTRVDYLCRTIAFLKEHGNVFLVRMPVGKEMRELEEAAMPNFGHLIDSVSSGYKVPFLDMSSNTEGLKFTDVHHLHKTSSEEFSKYVAERLKPYLSKDNQLDDYEPIN